MWVRFSVVAAANMLLLVNACLFVPVVRRNLPTIYSLHSPPLYCKVPHDSDTSTDHNEEGTFELLLYNFQQQV